MIVAIGFEVSATTDAAAVAVASTGDGKQRVNLAFYGSPEQAVTQVSALYADTENSGVYLDPMPCAGVLDQLRAAGVWLHELSPEDVAAAAWQFVTEVRGRRVKLAGDPALRESMRTAVPRPLAARFAFERRKVTADQTPLNAAAFALLGLRRNESLADPGVYVV